MGFSLSQLLRLRDTTVQTQTARPAPADARKPRLRLDYIDGIRALAALAVVFHHAFQMYGLGLESLGMDVERGRLGYGVIDQLIYYGYYMGAKWGFYAVQVFIVISGFSLMLPVVRSLEEKISGGLVTFTKRRVRRILPPYYAAVVLSLLLIVLVPGMNMKTQGYWDLALPALRPDTIISHLFLVHNLSINGDPFFGLKINPPLWSIAVEWQIYFLFPLLIVIWRRWGSLVTVLVGLAAGIVPAYFGLITIPFSMSHFLGLFTLGMFAASVAFSRRATERGWLQRLPWGRLALLFAVAFAGIGAVDGLAALQPHMFWLKDILLGLAVTCMLIYIARVEESSDMELPFYLHIFKAGPIVKIGHYSYSVYLIHAPILALVAVMFSGLPITLAYLGVLFVGIPLAVLVAYLFYLAFERPFMSQAARASDARKTA